MKFLISLTLLLFVSCGHQVPDVTEGAQDTTTTTTSPVNPVSPSVRSHQVDGIILNDENDFSSIVSLSSLGIDTTTYQILPQTLHAEVVDNGNGELEYNFSQILLSQIDQFEDGRFQDAIEVFATDAQGETLQHRITLTGTIITDFDGSDVSGSDGGSDNSGSTNGGSDIGGGSEGGFEAVLQNDRFVFDRNNLTGAVETLIPVLENDELDGFTVTGLAVDRVNPFDTVEVSTSDNIGVIVRGLDTIAPQGFSIAYTVFGRNNETGFAGELGSAILTIIVEDGAGSDNAGSDNAGSDNTGSDNAGSDNAGSDNAGSDNGIDGAQINSDRVELESSSLTPNVARAFDVLSNDELDGFRDISVTVSRDTVFGDVEIRTDSQGHVIFSGLERIGAEAFSIGYTVFGTDELTGISGELGSARLSIIIDGGTDNGNVDGGSDDGGSDDGGNDNDGSNDGEDSDEITPVESQEHRDICNAFAQSENTKLEAVYTHKGHFGENAKPACSISQCFGQGDDLKDQIGRNNAVSIDGKRYKARVEDFNGVQIARLCYTPDDKDNELSIHGEGLDFLRRSEGFAKIITVLETKGEMPLEIDGLSTQKIIRKQSLSNVPGSHLELLAENRLENGTAVMSFKYDIADSVVASLDINTYYHDSYLVDILDNSRVIYTVQVNVSFRIKGEQDFILKDQILDHEIKVFNIIGGGNPDKILDQEIDLTSLATVFSEDIHTIVSLDCVAEKEAHELQENDGSQGASSFHFVWRDQDLKNLTGGISVTCTGEFLNERTGNTIQASDENPLRVKFK